MRGTTTPRPCPRSPSPSRSGARPALGRRMLVDLDKSALDQVRQGIADRRAPALELCGQLGPGRRAAAPVQRREQAGGVADRLALALGRIVARWDRSWNGHVPVHVYNYVFVQS